MLFGDCMWMDDVDGRLDGMVEVGEIGRGGIGREVCEDVVKGGGVGV